VEVIDPDDGPLASRGEYGMGRLPQPAALLDRLEAVLPGPAGPWDGLRVLITAGGTREPIDPVRYIGNRSSGRMGIAMAAAAARRGADVTLVAANVSLPVAPRVKTVAVQTAAELAAATREHFAESQVVLMAAAVADFTPTPAAGKLNRAGSGGLDLHLEETEDVIGTLAADRRDGQTLVGFAAEHGADAISRARDKLERKGLDAIIFNDVSNSEIGFDSKRNEVTIVERDSEHQIPIASKDEIAEAILDRVAAIRAGRRSYP